MTRNNAPPTAHPPPATGSAAAPFAPTPSQPQSQSTPQQQQETAAQDEGPDPSTLPPVTAPPSHPAINTEAVGMLDGRTIFDVDLAAMADKPWRRPGADISDWFNYGFDEISWEAYIYRRRELGDMASVLKTNVIVSCLPLSYLYAGRTRC